MRAFALLGVLSLAACGAAEVAPPVTDAPPPEPVAKVPHDADYDVLAPSPLDLVKELQQVGVTRSVHDLLPAALPEPAPADDKDRVAFQTGVVFAHTLLGGRNSSKEVFLSQVRFLRNGMATIGLGQGALGTIDRAIEQIENDTASRLDFLQELDEQMSMALPEEGWGSGDDTGPLLQAGAWLAGLNVLARAIERAEAAEAADKLLARPKIARYYLRYLEGEGSAKAGPIATTVSSSLRRLDEVTSKTPIGVDGAKEIAKITGDLLELF